MVGTATVIRGDARALPLPDASVDLVVTSPPYFALRSYTDGGEHYAGQIGSEATPADYIDALLECTREMVRVLKPGGSIWVDLGDSYYSGKGAPGRTTVDGKSEARTVRRAGGNPLDGPSFGIGRKSLILLPERYRIAAVDQLGLIARAVVIWSKPNGLPESVTDRVRRSHEDWVHLTKAPRYFSAVDEIRETYAPETTVRYRSGYKQGPADLARIDKGYDKSDGGPTGTNPLGKLPGSVWTIPTEPLTVPDHVGVDHFAAFPTEWPRRIILGWSPSGICTVCGEGRRPVVDVERVQLRQRDLPMCARLNGERIHGPDKRAGTHVLNRSAIVGEACACPEPTAPTRPSVVLDPFGGTGTVPLVAKALGRIGIAVDLSADYCRLARWRTHDPGQLAKAMRVDKPPVIAEAQLSLEWEVA